MLLFSFTLNTESFIRSIYYNIGMLISYYFVLGNEFIVTEMTTLDTYAGCSDEKNGG